MRSTRVVLDGELVTAVVGLRGTDRGPVVTSVDLESSGCDVTDIGTSLIVPAPMDIHFHGAGGHVVPPGGDVHDIDAALAAAATRSTWRDPRVAAPAYDWIATLPIPATPPSDPVAELRDASRAIAAARSHAPSGCVGLRLEGCFLNPQRAGVWPPSGFRTPTIELLDELHDAAQDGGTPLRIVDLAPELLPENELESFVEHAVALGMTVSLAHTDATWEQARAAIDAGASLATHTWNAMRPTAHRDPGVVAAVLADARVACELICDGVHLHRGTIALSIAACGPGGWLAISDASPFAGCEPGMYDWAGTTVRHDGVALRDEEGRLAGSASLLWQARDELLATGVSSVECALAIGAVPRRILDTSRSLGLQVGDPAWVVGDA